MKRFYEIRANALFYWINSTNRIITDEYSQMVTDELRDTYECKWQNKSTCGHVSLFCSLGEWASNITDILRDESLDKNYFEDQNEANRIYRYYTRLLLVVSEILTDFQDIYLQAEDLKSDRKNKDIARKFLYSIPEISEYSIQNLFDFINSVCKHKTSKVHKCNHHLPFYFSDNIGDTNNLNDLIHIKDLKFESAKTGILMPKLQHILSIIVICYKSIDNYFNKVDNAGFQKICKSYSV
jgi:hypothetical protein